jgi:hypothetical protein
MPHDPSVRVSEDSSCLRPRGYCDGLASERAKTVHALDRAATVTSSAGHTNQNQHVFLFHVSLRLNDTQNNILFRHHILNWTFSESPL